MNLQVTAGSVTRDELADVCEAFTSCRVEFAGGDRFKVTGDYHSDAAYLAGELEFLHQLTGQKCARCGRSIRWNGDEWADDGAPRLTLCHSQETTPDGLHHVPLMTTV